MKIYCFLPLKYLIKESNAWMFAQKKMHHRLILMSEIVSSDRSYKIQPLSTAEYAPIMYEANTTLTRMYNDSGLHVKHDWCHAY